MKDLDERGAVRAARIARTWIGPVVSAYEDAGLTVSTVVMLDDYFAPRGADVALKTDLLRGACDEAGVRVDHVAYEAACAGSAEQMAARVAGVSHELGRDGRHASEVVSAWLSNGDPGRGSAFAAAGDARSHRSGRTRRRSRHAVHLDVELWTRQGDAKRTLWSCPSLAAWWQLIRLGMLRDEATGRSIAPPGTESRPGAPPFAARRTLTLLDPRFIEVEHAVRVILERVQAPGAGRRARGENPHETPAGELLECIAYQFIPSSFELQPPT